MPINLDSRISTAEVTTGSDDGMPAANLHWDDSVTYTLDLGAALLFNFSPTNPISLVSVPDGANVLNTVEVERHPKFLRVKLLTAVTWAEAKATLFFEPVALNQTQLPASGGLDPKIINKGQGV